MCLAVSLAALLAAATPSAPATSAAAAPKAAPAARPPAAASPAPGAAAREWAAWNRARARQGLLPRKPPASARTARAARAAPRVEPAVPTVARGRAKRARPVVVAAVAAPDAPALDAAAFAGGGPEPAPAPSRPSALHALLEGLSRGAAPMARVEVEGDGLGATVRGVRASVAVVARAGNVMVALGSELGVPRAE